MDLATPEPYNITDASPFIVDPTLPHIHICAPTPELCAIAQDIFVAHPAFTVSAASLTTTGIPHLVVPGDSFGLFTEGGVDSVVAEFLSAPPTNDLVATVQTLLRERWVGELPVGQAVYIPQRHATVRGVIYAPTARIPGDVSETVNAYLAFRATLLAARDRLLSHLAAPLFATGAGGMDPITACLQMREAYDTIARRTFLTEDFGWSAAWKHHRSILPDPDDDFARRSKSE
jgi:O-acetyl-ADP-ribose deacetylase (regulator of RNase III)